MPERKAMISDGGPAGIVSAWTRKIRSLLSSGGHALLSKNARDVRLVSLLLVCSSNAMVLGVLSRGDVIDDCITWKEFGSGKNRASVERGESTHQPNVPLQESDSPRFASPHLRSGRSSGVLLSRESDTSENQRLVGTEPLTSSLPAFPSFTLDGEAISNRQNRAASLQKSARRDNEGATRYARESAKRLKRSMEKEVLATERKAKFFIAAFGALLGFGLLGSVGNTSIAVEGGSEIWAATGLGEGRTESLDRRTLLHRHINQCLLVSTMLGAFGLLTSSLFLRGSQVGKRLAAKAIRQPYNLKRGAVQRELERFSSGEKSLGSASEMK